MQKLSFILWFCLLLTACGGDSGGDDSNDDIPSSDRNVSDNANPALSDLVGGWRVSYFEINDRVDEYYFAISDDGHFTVYDYYGDTYDRGESCYRKSDSLILTDFEDGYFETFYSKDDLYFGTLKLSLADNKLAGFDVEAGAEIAAWEFSGETVTLCSS